MAGNNPDGLDMSNKNRNNKKKNQSPGWSVSLVIGDYPARFGEHLFTTRAERQEIDSLLNVTD